MHVASAGAWLGIDVVLGVMVPAALRPQVHEVAESGRQPEPRSLRPSDPAHPPVPGE